MTNLKAKVSRRGVKKFGTKSLPSRALRHVERSLEKQWKRYRKELKRCQKKFSQKSVHESRVAARRLLATIELLEGVLSAGRVKKVRQVLKRHLHTFNDLRDTQVQIVAVTSLQAIYPAARMFCEWLQKRDERFARQACNNIKRIRTKPLSNLIANSQDDFEKYLKKSGAKAAASLLSRSVNRAFERTARLRAQIRPALPRTIHRTRVAFKRFRYMVELLAEHLPADEKVIAEMQHYQTMMGDIQDADVLLQSFDKFVRKKNIRSASAFQLREELVRRRKWLIKVYLDAAGQLRDFWPLSGKVTRVMCKA
jgi:CHAD domain-containing protein